MELKSLRGWLYITRDPKEVRESWINSTSEVKRYPGGSSTCTYEDRRYDLYAFYSCNVLLENSNEACPINDRSSRVVNIWSVRLPYHELRFQGAWSSHSGCMLNQWYQSSELNHSPLMVFIIFGAQIKIELIYDLTLNLDTNPYVLMVAVTHIVMESASWDSEAGREERYTQARWGKPTPRKANILFKAMAMRSGGWFYSHMSEMISLGRRAGEEKWRWLNLYF